MSASDKSAFDPLDMRNYSLEKFKEIKAGPWMERLKCRSLNLIVQRTCQSECNRF